MFKFLKEKISNWVKKSKESIQEKEKDVEKKEKEKEKQEIKEESKKVEKKQEKTSKKQEKEIKKEVQKDSSEVENLKKEIKEFEKNHEEKQKEIKEGKLKQAEEKLEQAKEELKEIIQEKEKKEGKTSFFSKLKETFSYKLTQENFNTIFEDLEMLLLENNVALEVVEKIKDKLEQELINKEIKKQDVEKEIKSALKKTLQEIIIEPDDILDTIKQLKEQNKGPFKIIFFGINGAGKTTTIAKFAHLLKKNNLSCILAAGDTFRAASIEQIQIHGDKLGLTVIKQDYGSDPSAVAFDANKYAEKHKIDVVLIDTAGRMHTKDDLLREIEKIVRVSKPDLKVFVAESIAGNDAIEQAKAFDDMVSIDGSILSKADVDEKGGTIISISSMTHKPIFYLGTGQNYENLELFDKEKFINQLGLDD